MMPEPRTTRDAFPDENIERPLSRKNFTDSLTTPAESVEATNLLRRDGSELTENDDTDLVDDRSRTLHQETSLRNDFEQRREISNLHRVKENQSDLMNLPASRVPETPDQKPLDGESSESSLTPLFSEFEMNDFRARWDDVQAGFVDSPHRAVEQADELVATVMQRIADSFAEERSALEKQWGRGDNVSTEDLRVALQRYRAFFGRLLNAA